MTTDKTKKTTADARFDALFAATCDAKLSKADVAVYASLLRHARGKSSRPSRVRIAKDAGIDFRNVSRHTRKLEVSGYVEIVKTGGRHTNIHNLPKLGYLGVTADASGDGYLGVNLEASNSVASPLTPQRPPDLGVTADAQSFKLQQQQKKAFVDVELLLPTLGRLWDEHRMPNWFEWSPLITEERRQQIGECLALVASAKGRDVEEKDLAELLAFLREVPIFAGTKFKDDGTKFVLTPAYLFGDTERFARILEGEWGMWGRTKTEGPRKTQRKLSVVEQVEAAIAENRRKREALDHNGDPQPSVDLHFGGVSY